MQQHGEGELMEPENRNAINKKTTVQSGTAMICRVHMKYHINKL